jgi:hypothetical protein
MAGGNRNCDKMGEDVLEEKYAWSYDPTMV